MKTQIDVIKIKKDFLVDKRPINIIKEISTKIMYGDFIVIHGPSGCGKSTLLNIICGWEPPTSGQIFINGQDIYKKSDDDRARLRQTEISMIHQSANWVKSLNVIDNIAVPYLLAGKDKTIAKKRAEHLLDLLNLAHYRNYKPMDLSGGQQQRISLIRALIDNPKIIMADEPTGNLDTISSDLVMKLLHQINYEFCRTIVMVTHNPNLINFGNKNIKIVDGQVVAENINKNYKTNPSPSEKDIINLTIDNSIKNNLDEEQERKMSKIT